MGDTNFPPELVEKKNRQRQALRKEYLKQLTNPHVERAGHIFDPGMQRYQSMRATRFEFFRETPKNVWKGMTVLAIPFAITMYLFYKDRTERERSFRSGEVAYKDRLFKFQ